MGELGAPTTLRDDGISGQAAAPVLRHGTARPEQKLLALVSVSSHLLGVRKCCYVQQQGLS